MNKENNNFENNRDVNNDYFGQQQLLNNVRTNDFSEQLNQDVKSAILKNNSNRNKLLIIIILLFIAIAIILIFNINSNKINNKEIDNQTNVVDSLLQDYNDGNISLDEYVRYMLYVKYDNSLLNDKYKLSESADLIEIDDFIEKNYANLSNETLKYYFDKINLRGISFELNKKNEKISNSEILLTDMMLDTVYADGEKVTNLDKALLSRNGNFIVWYTTTGDSATDSNTAKRIAEGLEDTVEQYNKLFGYNFKFNSNVISKGDTYNNQLKILEAFGIDTKYMEKSMHVYLVNYTADSLAVYISKHGDLMKFLYKIFGGDKHGSIILPYILIKPSSFNDFERLEQLYNHELFHHYQHNILCGYLDCKMGNDPYILEATANWASSLVTKKTTNNGFLNEWAGTAVTFTNSLMGKEFHDKYGDNKVGYALFVYLYNYSTYVTNGIENIINSIYQNDAFEYLFNNATIEELTRTQENISLKNLSQDYTNKNLIKDSNFDGKLPIDGNISHTRDSNKNYKNIDIPALGINYYMIDGKLPIDGNISHIHNSNKNYKNIDIPALGINYYMIDDNSNYAFEIDLTKDNDNMAIFFIAEKNGKYYMIDSSIKNNKKHKFDTNNYGEFDSLYIAVANILPNSSNHYSINFKNIEKKNVNKQYISLIDCDGYFDEDVEKMIDTYYYDKFENVYKYVVTVYWKDEEDAKYNYETNLTNSNYTDVRINGKIVSFQYTDEVFKNYFPSMTKSSIKRTHIEMCSSDNVEVDYNPNY